jgi:hypothetical protein
MRLPGEVMIDHQERIKGLVREHLKKRSMGVPYGIAVSPCFGPVPTEAGPMGQLGAVWVLIVTISSKPLIGVPDIGLGVPIPGVLPPDKLFTDVAEKLLDSCLEQRSLMLNVGSVPNAR